MQAPALVVLAAGIGSRYGGLKQIDPVGPNGEIVLDYSVYDAWQAGFRKVVFVIREELEDALRDHFAPASGMLDIRYCHQKLDDLPPGMSVPPGREKPWGTAHAVRAARNAVAEPFAVINADDFYGRQSFRLLGEFLSDPPNTKPPTYAMVAFTLANTLSKYGTVARGICTADADMTLTNVEEHTKISQGPDDTIRGLNSDHCERVLHAADFVSMNMWGFTSAFLQQIDAFFVPFLEQAQADPKAEFYLPWVVDQLIQAGQCTVRVLKSPEKWFGVTYREDRSQVQQQISQRVGKGVYPSPLFP